MGQIPPWSAPCCLRPPLPTGEEEREGRSFQKSHMGQVSFPPFLARAPGTRNRNLPLLPRHLRALGVPGPHPSAHPFITRQILQASPLGPTQGWAHPNPERNSPSQMVEADTDTVSVCGVGNRTHPGLLFVCVCVCGRRGTGGVISQRCWDRQDLTCLKPHPE